MIGSSVRHLVNVLTTEAGRLELDARRADERGFRQLAAELRGIRLRFLQVIAAVTAKVDD